ncbi:MAG: V-type ATP synthase subunit F [Firmicutes bacterium]|nr:V-type ATP synthase subunit F [Bacillota bacterium]
MSMYKFAAVGEEEAVFGFRALGVDVFIVKHEDDAASVLQEARKGGYAVIFVTEQVAKAVPDVIEGFQDAPLPAVLIIPGVGGSLGLASQRMKRIVEKAVGADILFQERG